jgi:hypothetical protein
MSWKHPHREPPPENTIVLLRVRANNINEVRTAVRRIEHPSFEDTFQAYSYWDDPYNEGQSWEMEDLLEWTEIPQ